MSREDWNKADSMPMEDRTFVRMRKSVVKPKDYVYAINPFSGVKVMLGHEYIDGAYLLEDTASPSGYVEIRTVEGVRWMVRSHDIESTNGRPLDTPEADVLFVEKLLRALEEPEVYNRIYLLFNKYATKLRHSMLDERKNQVRGPKKPQIYFK